MVFVVPLDQKALTDQRFQIIIHNTPITVSDRSSNAGKVTTMPTGVLTNLATTLSTNTTGAGSLPRKGELYIQLLLLKKIPSSDNAMPVPLLNGYVYRGNDIHWTGEVPIQDGDQLQTQWFNSFATVPYSCNITGFMIKAVN